MCTAVMPHNGGPLAVCLVTSGSRGNKLLFYDKGFCKGEKRLKSCRYSIMHQLNTYFTLCTVLFLYIDGASDVLRYANFVPPQYDLDSLGIVEHAVTATALMYEIISEVILSCKQYVLI